MSLRTAQWRYDYQFNAVFAGSPVTFTNTEVVGSGSSAKIQLERNTDNDDDINYNSVGDYTFSDSNKITVDQGGNNKAKLKQLGGTSTNFPFTTPANYTYDSGKIEVAGGVASLLGTLVANATFYADYNSNIDGTEGNGVLTGTGYGGAAVSGGKLDLIYSDVRYVIYDADLNADSPQVGCYRMLYTPNYSGTPASSQVLVRTAEADLSNNNEINLFHQAGTGELRVNQRNASGATEVSFGSVWSPTSGVEYEIELNYDLTTGNNRLFVDGILHSSDLVTTGTRSVDIADLRVGTNRNAALTSNFKLDNLVIFDAVQHTSNYTPGEVVFQDRTTNPYIVPNTGFSFIAPLDAFTETSTKPANTEIKYQLSSDDGVTWKWWNGAAWAVITGGQTDSWYYANESNTASIVNTNIASLAGSGTLKFRAFLHTSDNNETPELDNIFVSEPLSFSTTDDLYIDTTNASQITSAILFNYLTATITNTLPANTDIKLMLSVDGRLTWLTWTGSVWDSPASETLRSSAASITNVQNNISSLSVGNKTLDVRLFLYTSDGSTSPEVDNINITGSTGYKTSGEYISTKYVPFEINVGIWARSISHSIVTPSGCTATIKADFLQTNVLDPRNSNYITYNDGDEVNIFDARWIQWSVTMTSDGNDTPQLDYVEVYFLTGIGMLNLLKKLHINRWQWNVNGAQWLIYDDDGITPLAQLNLFDDEGNPATTSSGVFDRVPV